jgi:EpsI family protein
MSRNAMKIGAALLLAAALYWPHTVALGRYWLHQDVNARAGILITILSGFLLFRGRERFERITLGPLPWAGLPLVVCAVASVICWRAGILTLQLVFLPLILWLTVLCLFGWQAARAAAFALGFLYFAMPGWDALQPPLQRLTADAVSVLGPLVGLPVVMSGVIANLPAGVTFAITRACSGADFLAVGLAIAALHGELEQASPRRRAGLVGGMLLLALVSNWLRVILILAIGHLSQMRNPLATRDHVALGWVVFACALLLFVWVVGRLGADVPAVQSAGTRLSGTVAQPAGQRPAIWRYGIAFAAFLAVPVLVCVNLPATAARADTATLELPPGSLSWRAVAGTVDPLWQPTFVGAGAERRGHYQSADGPVVEVVAFGYPRQTQGAQILNNANSLLGQDGLTMEAVGLTYTGRVPHSEVITVDPSGRRSLIWSVIDVGGHLFGEPLLSQLWYGAHAVVGTPYSALYALKTRCDVSCDAARAVLGDFLRTNGPALFASLPAAGKSPAEMR